MILISQNVDKMMEDEALEYNGITISHTKYDIILVKRAKIRFEKIKEK